MGTLNADVDEWEISRRRITLEEVIGSGSFGTVWRAVLSSGNGQPGIQFVAAKCFTRQYLRYPISLTYKKIVVPFIII